MNKLIQYVGILLLITLASTIGQINNSYNKPIDKKILQRGCGYRPYGATLRILGSGYKKTAQTALFAEFPWTVAVFNIIDGRRIISEKPLVDGSLIHRQAVLTNAHNFHHIRSPSELLIRAGEWNLNYTDEPLLYQHRRVSKIIQHPHFDRVDLHNNLAILILKDPVEYAGNANVVCLRNMTEIADVSRCIVSGWASNNYGLEGELNKILQYAELPLVNRKICQMAIHARAGRDQNFHDSFICAGEKDRDKLCLDGSPLVCPINGEPDRYAQVGVAQWGFLCKNGSPEVYTNVLYARHWIDQVLRENGLESTN